MVHIRCVGLRLLEQVLHANAMWLYSPLENAIKLRGDFWLSLANAMREGFTFLCFERNLFYEGRCGTNYVVECFCWLGENICEYLEAVILLKCVQKEETILLICSPKA